MESAPPAPLIASGARAMPGRQGETRRERLLTVILAILVALGFLLAVRGFWVPAHPGLDANGYLVGGKMLSLHGTAAYVPREPGTGAFDPHQFVGVMWVGRDYGTPAERFYPKYPLGYPALIAAALRIGGSSRGVEVAYGVNPLCAAAALLATFVLVRQVAGSWAGLLAMLLLATSPTFTAFATTPVSHASALAAVSWGMVALLAWWEAGGFWQAAVAGVLLGFAATIRYTEVLLLLPLALVAAFSLRERMEAGTLRRWGAAAVALLAWALPVAGQLAYNRVAMHANTGYDPTNESAAFAWAYFADNWDMLVRHMAAAGLVLILPVAILGLGWMFAWRWKLATVLAAWIVPSLGVYSLYYFAKEHEDIGYVRFVLTVLPALLACAFWLVGHIAGLARGAEDGMARRVAVGWTISVGVLVALACAVQAKRSVLALETEHRSRLILGLNAREVRRVAPPGSAVFCADRGFDDHLQFVGDYLLYTGETFDRRHVEGLRHVNPEEPQVLDPARREALYGRLKGMSQAELTAKERQIVRAALAEGRRVFYLAPVSGRGSLPRIGSGTRMPPGLVGRRTGEAGGDLRATVAGAWRISVAQLDRRTARQRLWGGAPPPGEEVVAWVAVEVRGAGY